MGHKEDELAKATAEIVSATLKTNVIVAARIHWDNITEDGILRIIKNSRILVDIILDRIHDEFSEALKKS